MEYPDLTLNTYDAYIVWRLVRNKFFKDLYSELQNVSSSIHLLYVSGVLSLGFLIISAIHGRFKACVGFLIAFIVFNVSAFLYDRYFEDLEYHFLGSVPPTELDRFVRQVGRRPRSKGLDIS